MITPAFFAFAAAVYVHNTSFEFAGSGNLIHSLSNGIVAHQSDLIVKNCRMLNIQPDAAYAYSGNGAGIFARGDSGFFALEQHGDGATGLPGFQDCRWGIYTEYMNVYSVDNNMVDMGTAYRVEKSGYRDIDILNNTLDTKYDGIQLFMNDGAAHLLVQNNQITFATNPPPGTLVKGYTAINVREANTLNLNSVIASNTIHYRTGVSTARTGIGLTAANDYKVLDNTLLMTNNAVNYAGIATSGCRRPLIGCNTVTGSYSNYGLDPGQSAIRNNMGFQPTIYCNTVDGTTNGIYFSGPAYGTDLSGNNIRHHKWGLHLDGTAVIGDQDHKGNLWYFAAEPGGQQARCDQPLNAPNSRFRVDPTITIPGSNPIPTTVFPSSGWFIITLCQNYLCDDGSTDYCAQFDHDPCEGCKTGLDGKIASDSLENNPYTEETKWIMKGDLYKKVDDNQDMLTDPELADFYNELQGSTTEQFKLINDDYLKVFDLDASIRAYLNQNRDQLGELMAQLKYAISQLADPALTPIQRQAIMTTISGLQQSIGDLTALNNQALDAAATTKNLTAEAIKNTNAGVGTTELIEDNEKQVNDIYLRTVAQDVDAFSAGDASALFDIANQCPMVGGNAVYRARSLYTLIDDDQEYDDPALCLPYGITVRSMQAATAPQQAVELVPNPAWDEVTLVFGSPFEGNGTVTFYDAVGHEVLRRTFRGDQQRLHLTVAELAPAVYHYGVRFSVGEIGYGKFTVVR